MDDLPTLLTTCYNWATHQPAKRLWCWPDHPQTESTNRMSKTMQEHTDHRQPLPFTVQTSPLSELLCLETSTCLMSRVPWAQHYPQVPARCPWKVRFPPTWAGKPESKTRP